MTDLMVVIRQLGELSRDLDTAVAKLGDLDQARVLAEGAFKSAYARAFRDATGSVEDRKQQAHLECDKLWHTWSLAESAVKLQQQHLKALHARVDVGRSIFSARKSEMALAGSGVAP